MKITISYTISATKVIEVDDKFHQLTDEGGFEDLPYDVREELADELKDLAYDAVNTLPDVIVEAETNSLMWEC